MVGIVILNYNSWRDTRACIESIQQAEPEGSYRIYLVDNASPQRPEPELRAYLQKSQVVFIQSDFNRGYSAGNNLGIRRALDEGCDYVLISNADVRYEQGSIAKLRRYLENHLEVGIAGPKIILGNGKIQRECMMFKTGPREKYLLRTRFHIFFPRYNRRYWGREHDYERETFPVYAVMGCCFMVSRPCALEVFPLDEHTFLYEEELILGIRMEQAGWKTVYHPESVIHHLHGQSTQNVKAFAYTCNICSEIYFCRQYLGMSRRQILPLYWYRTALYFLKSLRSKDFVRERKNYFLYTRRRLDEKL